MTRLRDLSIRWKAALQLLVILLLIAGNLGVVWWFTQAQSDTGTAINEAGKQRMLINQMRLKAHLIAMDDGHEVSTADPRTLRAELRADAARFNGTLSDLREGNASMGISPAPPGVREQLTTVLTVWRPFRAHLETIASEPRTSQTFRESLEYVQANHAVLLAESDAVVERYEAVYRRQVTRLETVLAVLLGLDLLIIPLLFAFIDRRILRPINRITAIARSVANGEVDRSIPEVEADNEIGTLSRSLREMKEQLLTAIRDVRRFEQAVKHAGHAIYITDTDGRIEYVNPAFEEVTGYREEEVIGASPQLFTSDQQSDAYYRELWETIETGEVRQEEIVNRRATGELFHADQTIGPITDENDDIVGYVAIMADRTKLIVSNQQNQVLSRVLRHNLRTELNLILLYVKELATVEDTSEQEPFVDQIHERIDNLVDLSDKTDRFTRTLGRDDDWQQRLCAVVDLVAGSMNERFPDADITVEIPDFEVDVMANIQLVVEALVENAVIYNDQPVPEVTIAVQLEDDTGPPPMVRLEVNDNGPGIPDEERTVIEEGEETPLYHGSGLGLWIVHWTVTLAGGRVEIIDREPRGTTVAITLPHASVQPFPRRSDSETQDAIVTDEYPENKSKHND